MKTKTLILTVGLPRSGKSTWARSTGYPIVNRDAIRLALHGQAYIQEAESMVTSIEDYMVKALFLAGHDTVIIDATHLNANRRDRWASACRSLATKYRFQVRIQNEVFATSKQECIRRAKADNRMDLIPVIERMEEETDIPAIRISSYLEEDDQCSKSV